MLLTRRSAGTTSPQSRLARSLSGALTRTMDRRTFLARSGVAVGAGAFASQLPFNCWPSKAWVRSWPRAENW